MLIVKTVAYIFYLKLNFIIPIRISHNSHQRLRMIQRIGFVFISLILSSAAYADLKIIPTPFTHACENLLTLINRNNGSLNSEQISSFAHETFEGTKELSVIKKQFAFIMSVQAGGMTPPERTKLCIKGLQDSFQESELKEKAPKKLEVEANEPAIGTEIFASVQKGSSNAVKTIPKKRETHCTYGQDLECASNSTFPVTVGISSLEELDRKLSVTKVEVFSTNDCDCLKQNLARENKNINHIISKATIVYGQVDKAIAEAAGRKFINDYANFQEDIGYFETTTAWALQKDTEVKLSKEFLCTESKDFKEMIDAKCKANKMMGGREDRIAALLGSKNTSGSDALKNGLNDLLVGIKKPDEATNYSRQKYDDFRHGLTKPLVGQPELLVMDQLTAKIVQNADIKKDLKIFLDNGISPLTAMEQIISSEKYNKVVMQYVSEIDNPRCKEIVTKLKTLKGEEFEKEKSRIVDLALTIHPGFKSLLLDPKLFEKTVSKMKGLDDGIIEKAEEDLDMAGHFTERCDNLKKNLAEAVCTKPTDMRNKVKKSEMIKLLGANESIGAKNEEAIDLLICSTNYNQFHAGSAFDGLFFDEARSFLVSDFHLKSDNEGKDSFFSAAAKMQKDPSVEARMNKVANAFNYERVSTGTSDTKERLVKPVVNEADFVARVKQKFNSDKGISEVAPISQDKNESFSESVKTPTNVKSSQINSQFKSNASSAAEITKTVAQPVEESKSQNFANPRDELKNILSGGDQKKISSQLEDINDAEAQELINLRKQVLKSREEISALKLEQEAKRTRELQEQFQSLENKYESLRKEKVAHPERTFISNIPDSGAAFKSQNFGAANDRNPAFDNNLPKAEIRGGGLAQNAVGTQNQVGTVREAPKTNNSLTVDSPSHNVAGEKLTIKSSVKDGHKTATDPSLELITYLSTNDPDGKTLIDLKESGMIYTYDLQEDGKIVQVSKLIKYSQLSDEAKILVDKKLLLLSSKNPNVLSDLEKQKQLVKRKFSYQALKLEIMKIN